VRAAAAFSADVLKIDARAEAEKIEAAIHEIVVKRLKRQGVVLGLSGGIDSSVTAALSARALGRNRVHALFLPEADSSGDSLRLGRLLADTLGIQSSLEDITPILDGAGCYRRRDEAIRTVIPEYTSDYKCKLVLPNLLDGEGYAVFSVIVQSPAGEVKKARLPLEAYLGIVAATNFKQRTRKMMEYYYADRLRFAVAGTPNRLEYDQGFFVKNGDGAADLKPIAHLYKRQVYALAEYLGIPEEICKRQPTTDTYSFQQSQEEFYFRLPFEAMDLCLYGKNHGVTPAEVGEAIGLAPEQVERVYRMIDATRAATRYLQFPPLLAFDVPEIAH
jgi:NAD+ synthase